MDKIEYRVRPVTRYIVTRFEEKGGASGSGVSMAGEYGNADMAYEVGYALCKAEHDRLGWPPGDEGIIYPLRVGESASPAQQVRPAGVPRRMFMPDWTPAELAIRNAMLEVEKMPADTRLTDAVVLLGQAQSRVADFVDQVPAKAA